MIQKSGNSIYFRGNADSAKSSETLTIITVTANFSHGINISHIRTIYKTQNEHGLKKIPVAPREIYLDNRCSFASSAPLYCNARVCGPSNCADTMYTTGGEVKTVVRPVTSPPVGHSPAYTGPTPEQGVLMMRQSRFPGPRTIYPHRSSIYVARGEYNG